MTIIYIESHCKNTQDCCAAEVIHLWANLTSFAILETESLVSVELPQVFTAPSSENPYFF